MASAGKSRILVVGGTGYLGRHVVAASARLGHPTLALVRDTAPSDPAKATLLKSFQDAGVTLLEGDLDDQASLVSAVKAADVVISTVGAPQIADQTRLVAAIKEAGNVKRFIPSEFGLDADRSDAVEPARSMFITNKAAIRRAVEAAGVPYTYVLVGYFFGYGLPSIGQVVVAQAPPADKALVLGDGDTKVVFVDEADIATYTVLAADDPRAENKTLRIGPPTNTLSHNQLLALWETKTGKTFQRVHLPEDAVLRRIQEASVPVPLDIIYLSLGHATHIKGEHTKFEMDPSSEVDANELYPDVKYTTVDDYLNRLL
ncbi:isoflavone reductase homolog IRL-like [Miscanthus floridulus]|uniref:isoflavone reductase homolog IRL-like n=1 Tax=Miscanthus floridulus TaxID=154761 RepID=UPI003457AFCF